MGDCGWIVENTRGHILSTLSGMTSKQGLKFVVRYSATAEKPSNFTPVRGRLVLCLRSDDEHCDIDIQGLEEYCAESIHIKLDGVSSYYQNQPHASRGKAPMVT